MSSEFLLTNQFGGYSSLDLQAGVTRKYHGLLVAGLVNFERRNIVTSINEELFTLASKDNKYNFSGNYYVNQIEPGIKKYLLKAYYLPLPTQIYQIGAVEIRKTYEFNESANELKLAYRISTPEAVTLALEPLFNFRDINQIGLKLSNPEFKQISETKYACMVSPQWQVILTTNGDCNIGEFSSQQHLYPQEAERGYEASEDLLKLAKFSYNCPASGVYSFDLQFKLEPRHTARKLWELAKLAWETEENPGLLSDISRFHQLHPKINPNLTEFLVYNARKFIVQDKSRHSLIAGYHWFGEWGRDTFISMPGILLGLGKFHEAQKLLIDWGEYFSVGLLPNLMEGLHYNSLDAVLWYFNALWSYYEITNDKEVITKLLPKLETAINKLVAGSKYGIGVDSSGYLIWTDNTKALTWMDAVVEGEPVSSRMGAAVEIQALWYNALQITEQLAKVVGYKLDNLALIDQLESLLEQNLVKDFWLDSENYFADYIDLEGNVNRELRPNQLALFALPFRIKSKDNSDFTNKARKAQSAIESNLLTPVGLRTLSPYSSSYIANYGGSQSARDLAYHQGTVWPWLLGLYYKTILNYGNDKTASTAKVVAHIEAFWHELEAQHLSSIPELFDATTLKAGGAIAQAWSTAVLLETIIDLERYR